jgi:hypothetical protein
MTRAAVFYGPDGGEALALDEALTPVAAGVRAPGGLEVIETVDDGDGPMRSGLGGALELIAAGRAAVLLVARLRDAASTLGELVTLLAWLGEADAGLIAMDVGFDSSAAASGPGVAVLREVESWDREPHPGRRPRGRPGLSSVDPELVERLELLRERGLSLRAIAAALNAEGVPTPRGGAEWRPSSVQAALGYRRPRPPAPGGLPVRESDPAGPGGRRRSRSGPGSRAPVGGPHPPPAPPPSPRSKHRGVPPPPPSPRRSERER